MRVRCAVISLPSVVGGGRWGGGKLLSPNSDLFAHLLKSVDDNRKVAVPVSLLPVISRGQALLLLLSNFAEFFFLFFFIERNSHNSILTHPTQPSP